MSSFPYRDPALPLVSRVDDLLARMTLPEKVGQMLMLNGQHEPERLVADMQPGAMLHILNDELARAMDSAAQTRLGIPLLIGEDGIHGHSFHPGATIFPTQLALACSFDPELLEAVARATAREMATTGAHWTFSPVLCLARDLRWGRIGETFGEDPLLIGELGLAMIRGYQGRALDDAEGVLACAKHYAGYSETQGGRDASEADLTRRKLRSFFLPPFERAAAAGCRTFMTGYQAIDGLPSTANRWLLTEVLKEEWGFKGVLVTDWDNVGRLVWEQRVAPSPKEAAVIAIRCGNDLIMATPDFFAAAQAAVAEGLIDEAEIDVIVRRILSLKFEMGLFENPRRPDRARQASVVACPEHKALNLRAARESLVLLKNDDDILPLSRKLKRIAVVGPNADNDLAQLGDWSLGTSQYGPERGKQPRECTVTLLDGLKARAGAELAVEYVKGAALIGDDGSGVAEAVRAAGEADVIVAVVGDDIPFIGEMRSTATLELPGGQRALLEALHQTGKPLVLVLVNSKPLVLGKFADRAAAIVECFNPGMAGGLALAELLFGELNPSGKLPISIPRHVGQQPVYYSQVRGQHGDRYADLTQEPLFPFGFGLSYTSYTYSDLRLLSARLAEGADLELEITVQNTGLREGVELVQVYVSDLTTSVTWVERSLAAFSRVKLAAGERKKVRLTVPFERLSLVDAREQRRVEPGDFEVLVGPSSRRADLLTARFQVEGETFSYECIPGVARSRANALKK
jgi:beta-glucosidase